MLSGIGIKRNRSMGESMNIKTEDIDPMQRHQMNLILGPGGSESLGRAVKHKNKREEAIRKVITGIAYEAHMMGRIYTKGGEKEPPSKVFNQIDKMITAKIKQSNIPLQMITLETIKLIPEIAPERIMEIVCQYYKIDPAVMRSKSRKRIHALPRNIYTYLCRKLTKATLEDIGKTINRNHSTVLYGDEEITGKLKHDADLRIKIDFLEGLI